MFPLGKAPGPCGAHLGAVRSRPCIVALLSPEPAGSTGPSQGPPVVATKSTFLSWEGEQPEGHALDFCHIPLVTTSACGHTSPKGRHTGSMLLIQVSHGPS